MPIRPSVLVSRLFTRSRGAMRLIKPRAHSATMAFMVAHGCSLMPTAVHSFPTRDEKISSLLNFKC